MRAGLSRFVEHGDRRRLTALRFLQLGKTKRRGHAGRPAAHDQDVNVERLTIRHSNILAAKVAAPCAHREPFRADSLHGDDDVVPAFARHAVQRVAQDVAVAELVEDPPERVNRIPVRAPEDRARRPSSRRVAGVASGDDNADAGSPAGDGASTTCNTPSERARLPQPSRCR